MELIASCTFACNCKTFFNYFFQPKLHILLPQVASQEFIQEAACGNLSKVKAIMENGAVHVDVVDKKGHSALFAAAVSMCVLKQ